jgi:hypothetical protein
MNTDKKSRGESPFFFYPCSSVLSVVNLLLFLASWRFIWFEILSEARESANDNRDI